MRRATVLPYSTKRRRSRTPEETGGFSSRSSSSFDRIRRSRCAAWRTRCESATAKGFAWLLNEEVFDNSWAGFFVEAAIFLLVAAGAGGFAYTSVKAGSPPVPEQAIEEAKLIRETIEGEEPVPTPATPAAGNTTPPQTPGADA